VVVTLRGFPAMTTCLAEGGRQIVRLPSDVASFIYRSIVASVRLWHLLGATNEFDQQS